MKTGKNVTVKIPNFLLDLGTISVAAKVPISEIVDRESLVPTVLRT